jgi:hypothetical protein
MAFSLYERFSKVYKSVDSNCLKAKAIDGKRNDPYIYHLVEPDVNSNRESERLLGYFGELGELLPWFAARPPA